MISPDPREPWEELRGLALAIKIILILSAISMIGIVVAYWWIKPL